jgi:LacI family transcriptional regulator
MAVTLKLLAERTGKSITTVSRALAGYDDVSEETKELVRRVANELRYTPNFLARSLQKRRSRTISLILPTVGPRFSDPFFSEFLTGVANMAAERGYDLLLSVQAPDEGEMELYRRKVSSGQVDGFVVVRTRRRDPRIEWLHKSQVSFVAFGRTENDADFPFVDVDGVKGMRLIGEHLIGLGHRRIAFLSSPSELLFVEHRLDGLRQAMAAHGLDPEEIRILPGDLTQKSGYEATVSLLDDTNPPSAIVACNDLMALGAMSALHERGVSVGSDIAVTGFDDIPMAEHAHPPLTTIHQPIYEIGRMVCEKLVRLIAGEELASRSKILEPRLIVRSSCGSFRKQSEQAGG